MADHRIRLMGLWRNKSKNGLEYLTGRLGMARVLIFSNDQKSGDAGPDFSVFLVPGERPHERSDARAGDRTEAAPPKGDHGDLPF